MWMPSILTLSLLLWSALVFLLPMGAQSAENDLRPKVEDSSHKIIAEGQSPVFNGNTDAARLAALRFAYAAAVKRGSGMQITGFTTSRDLKQLCDVVSSRSRGYVRSYRVIKEGASGSNRDLYTVTIEADVLTGPSDEDAGEDGLRQFIDLLANPSVLILMPAQAGKTDTSSQPSTVLHGAEAAIARVFSSYGYRVITSDDLRAQGFVDPEKFQQQAQSGNASEVILMARTVEADVAILGSVQTAKSQIAPLGVSLIMASAETSAKAIIVSTGKTVQAYHHNDRSSAPDELRAYSDCLDKAGNSLADELAWKIPRWLAEYNREVRVIIRPVNAVKAQQVRDALSGINGTEAVSAVRMPTAADQAAEFLIRSAFITPYADEMVEMIRKKTGITLIPGKSDKYRWEFMVAEPGKTSGAAYFLKKEGNHVKQLAIARQ